MVTKRATTRRTTTKAAPKVAENLRNYELVFVVRPDVTDDNLGNLVDKVGQLVTSRGGTISGIERWGKRKLAYPIKHYTEGIYILGRFKLKAAASKEIETNLQITEEIIRYLIVKME